MSRSIRFRLLASLVVAGISGSYALLLGHHRVLEWERIRHHKEVVAELGEGLRDGLLTLPLPSGVGLEAEFSTNSLISPQIFNSPEGGVVLVSRTALDLAGGESVVLEVKQKIHNSSEHFIVDFLLIISAMTVALVFASILIGVFIWRQVARPFGDMVGQIEMLEAESFGSSLLDPEEHLEEFRIIVKAVNKMQIRLKAAWHRERSFIENVAHELRAPIAIVSGYAQRLQDDVSLKYQEIGNSIGGEANRIRDVIISMRELSLVDADHLVLSVECVEPEELILESFERLQHLAPDRLQLYFPPKSFVPQIQVDPERVHQCLAALTQNALHYSKGDVWLGVSATSSVVILSVRDQGPGIPVAERDQVLDRFVRGTTSSGTTGSGLGLSIVNDLMRAMKGRLLITDALGGGADIQLSFKALPRPPLQ